MRPKRLWEATIWLTQLALEELDNRLREVKVFCAVEDILLDERIGGHPLGKVAYYLGRGYDFDDIAGPYERSRRIEEINEHEPGAYQLVRLDVLLPDLRPLSAQTQLRGLELPTIPQCPRHHTLCESLTMRLVYCPPGISCSNTLESEARTFASKQLYSCRTWVQYRLRAWKSA